VAASPINQNPGEDLESALSDISDEDLPSADNERQPVKTGTGSSGTSNKRKHPHQTQVFDEDQDQEDQSPEVLPSRSGTQLQKRTSREGHEEDEGVSSQLLS